LPLFDIYLHYVRIGFVNVLNDFQQFLTDLFVNWMYMTCRNDCSIWSSNLFTNRKTI